MKKNSIKILMVVIILMMSVTVLAGCGEKEVIKDNSNNNNIAEVANTNLEKVENSVKSLNSEDINNIKPVADLSLYGISKDNLNSYLFNLNTTNMDLWAVLKPAEGKNEVVKEQMQSFINGMLFHEDVKVASKYAAIKTEEYNGYLIYVAVPKQDTDILNKIKNVL